MNTAPRHLALFLSGLAGGGAQRRMLTLARAFAKRGHRVDVVVPRSVGPFRAELSDAVRLRSLDSRWARLPGVRSRRGLWVLASVPALARYLARERPAVLLSTSNPANLAALWARALARTRVPVVVSVNVHLSAATGERQRAWGPLLRALVRRSYGSAAAVVANSRAVADDLARHTPVPRAKIAVIPNPVDADAIRARAREPVDHPWLAPGQPPLLLAVGKLKRQKDFATLIRALARVRSLLPARLVILGEGEERERLERLAEAQGVAAEVALPGFVANPFAWMARASVFVLCSAWEGFSNVLCEAMACGCPVVSTDCPGGSAEILEGGAYGPLVPVGDDRALADAILAVLRDPPEAERLRARVGSFSVEAAVDRYLQVLLAACDGALPDAAVPTEARTPRHA
jgi:glycosyltransferase involved in cell wall biosynthesis